MISYILTYISNIPFLFTKVAEEYKLQPETLMIAIGYVDRFLSKEKARNLQRSKLQLVGVTALMLASKYEEIYAPLVDDFVYITDYTYQREEVLEMEWKILDTLLYEMSQPTAYTFLRCILMGNHTTISQEEDALVALLCAYLAELALLDYKMVTRYIPSLIASSCVLLANFILFNSKPVWSQTLQKVSGNYRPSQLQECCKLIYKRLQETMRNYVSFRPTI